MAGGDGAHKTLWGWLRLLAPPPPQEQVRPATNEEQRKTISGWIHVHGRWFWMPNGNKLMRANRRFIAAFRKLKSRGMYD